MKLLSDVFKKNITAILLWIIVSSMNFAVFYLYGLDFEPALYSSLVGLFFLILFLTVDFLREKKHSEELRSLKNSVLLSWKNLPPAGNNSEEYYHEMICALGNELEKEKNVFEEETQNAVDYYTNWVHQIKTPIAVMRLKLSEDTPENRALLSELFRIEQYVDMVLQYIRLGSSSTDLLIREYSLDDLIKDSIHKYASQFVEKKLPLRYIPTEEKIVTDKKWFSCILDQLISNAIKYTPEGVISISVSDGILSVSDTGIGISKEDLPRIFEKGFTGSNGRIGEKSSGLGLYLSKKAADLLKISISVKSDTGVGSVFELNFKKESF